MALFLAGGVYAPVRLLSAAGAVVGHLLVRRLLSWGFALEVSAVADARTETAPV